MAKIQSNNVEVLRFNLNQAHINCCTFLSPWMGVDGFATMETDLPFLTQLMVESLLTRIAIHILT